MGKMKRTKMIFSNICKTLKMIKIREVVIVTTNRLFDISKISEL